ncbi:P-loop containing nucleoside triphosphate hydrolase protein [Russula earlei]|uniref:P-loop containing nucleoside triphosphate hydrolase protein n=1 Tax=Russula earlei TaxID=71964 RepID=A0ACC0UBX2_9AGAM|nr:P-loop containing nucleoside triphosphate hydrolase protein [Russula earlei]
MPPRRAIVKSGNAGNSSKSSKEVLVPSKVDASPPPLFPPGSKYPLSLLQERCTKNGWEKPVVDTVQLLFPFSVGAESYSHPFQPKRNEGWAFVVILTRIVRTKNGQEHESVRMEPHPPYICQSALEARHWGATYALYRFCNSIQLNRVLPSGPRDYWAELAAEHKNAPSHQSWMYDADPFAARKSVTDRQEKVAKKKEAQQTIEALTSESKFDDSPEVKLSSDLRELVENAIKKAIANSPEDVDAPAVIIGEDNMPVLLQRLENLGFMKSQARDAITFLSKPSFLASNLLSAASPLEACIEYLVLHIPEVDLPQRFLPGNNSSNPFVTSMHEGQEDIKKRWIEERAIKQAGWPAHIVRECTTEPHLLEEWALLVAALNRRLVGESWLDVAMQPTDGGLEERITADEMEAMGASYADDNTFTLVMPLFLAPIQLHFVIPPGYSYNRTSRPPPMYLTSPSVPAYVRLHLLAKLLDAFEQGAVKESTESICVLAMQVLEEHWAIVEDQGPPNISDVLKHFAPPVEEVPELKAVATADVQARSTSWKPRSSSGSVGQDLRSDAEVMQEFDTMRQDVRYAKMHEARCRLPAFSSKDDFLAMLVRSRVVVVVGETGSGKTTQLPQFILDSLIESGRGSSANILVTQPRRISAISVAVRVHTERLTDGSVGYVIRGESRRTNKTKLLFCTTGVLLRRLGSGDDLNGVTHVIIDEVHERSVEGDFLLLELKELLKQNSTLKVVLMSATINHETFVRYFSDAPLLRIPGFAYPVTDMFLEDFIDVINYHPSANPERKRQDGEGLRVNREECLSAGLDGRSATAVQTISRSGRVDYALITATVNHIIGKGEDKGGILVFLPGVQEIRQCIDSLQGSSPASQAKIFPLHANLSSDEQRAVFAPTSKWKIVVATNVAETSITIDDIVYVIDAGKVKESQYDPESGLTKLIEQWITRAAGRQRRGRAGRTRPGVCYKLYTRWRENKMEQFPRPEILRVPLESICLSVKAMREDEDVKEFLSHAIDPPEVAAMDKALSVLGELGALGQDGRLTALGRHIATLPLDLRLGKMLILATVFQCLDPALTIAACLSSKPVFLSPMEKRDEATAARARFAREKSDILTDVRAYDECMRIRQEESPSAMRAFCSDNYIAATTIRDIGVLRNDLLAALTTAGLVQPGQRASAPELNAHAGEPALLKALLLAALYPRIARIALPRQAVKFAHTASGAVARDVGANQWRATDMRGARVWVHPGSVQFSETRWRSGMVVSFERVETASKVFLRDVTEVPLYALLLFGGHIAIDHVSGGLTVGGRVEGTLRLRAWPRIAILVQQLRRLLDAALWRALEGGGVLEVAQSPVIGAMLTC